jgi:tetratricopeptide (TPR) repeat protein
MGGLGLNAARMAPKKAEDLKQRAEADFEAAEDDFQKALELGLEADLLYTLHMNRGVLRYRRQQFEKAIADFERAIELNPTRDPAYASLARALAGRGDRAEAIARLDQAITLLPAAPALRRMRAILRNEGRPTPASDERALADLEEAIRLDRAGGRELAEDHALRGKLLLRLKRPTAALVACDAALALDPDAAGAHLDRVTALVDLGRFEEVILSCDGALAQGPPSAEMYELRGLARVGKNDFSGAIDDYTQALALRPGWTRALGHRGRAYLFANAPELAWHDFDAVARLAPNDPDGFLGRGAALVRLRRHRDAEAEIERGLKMGNPTPNRLYDAARTFAQAAVVAASEIKDRGRQAIRDSQDYESRAAQRLAQALNLTPASDREKFWREVVVTDAAMARVRQRARPVGPPGSPSR